MLRVQIISAGLSMTTLCSLVHAQQAISIDDDFVLTDIIFDTQPVERRRGAGTLEPITHQQLGELRSHGIDPSWIASSSSSDFELPRFDPRTQHDQRLTQNDHPIYIESWVTRHQSDRGVRLNDSLSFSVGRTTELRDGNISGSAGTLKGNGQDDNSGERISSLTQDEGEYDVYDLSLEWDAINAGPVTISVLSGLKAIEANIGKRVTVNGDTRMDTTHRFAALPMVGSGVRWEISDALSFSSAALTHPIETGDALIDFNASTDLRISNNIDFSAGYRIIRSSFEVGSIDTDVHQEGLFARIQIDF